MALHNTEIPGFQAGHTLLSFFFLLLLSPLPSPIHGTDTSPHVHQRVSTPFSLDSINCSPYLKHTATSPFTLPQLNAFDSPLDKLDRLQAWSKCSRYVIDRRMPRLNLRSFVSLKSSFSKGTTPPLCPYSIWKHIAAGTSGTVYEGLWPTHSTLPEVSVAIKKVPKFQRNQSRSPSRTLSSQFRHEVVAMVTAHAAAHLGVIQPYDVYLNDPDHWVLIMEKAKGNLLDLLANRQDLQKFYPSAAPPSYPIPEAVIRSVYDQPITTLTTLNDRGIVHRDIKPENLLYSCSESGCTVKITDFAGATLTSKQNFPPRSLITPEMLPLCLLSLKCITVKHLKTMDVYTLMASIYDAHIYDPSVEKKPTSKAKSTFGLGISMASSYVKREWKDGKVGSRHVSKELIALFNAVLLEENWKKSPQTFGELSHLFDAWKKASLAF